MSVSLCEVCGNKCRSPIKSIGDIQLLACSPPCELELRRDMLGTHYRNMLQRLSRTLSGPEHCPPINAALEAADDQRDLRQVKRMIEDASEEEARIVDRGKE